MQLVDYLHRYSEQLDILFLYQNEGLERDLAGAIRTALPFCSGTTLLLLPDQYFEVHDEQSSAQEIRATLSLAADHGWAALAAPITDEAILRNEGALRVEKSSIGKSWITAASEKPENPEEYNAAWVAVAVAEKNRDRLHKVIQSETASPLIDAPARLIKSLHNMNTPEG